MNYIKGFNIFENLYNEISYDDYASLKDYHEDFTNTDRNYIRESLSMFDIDCEFRHVGSEKREICDIIYNNKTTGIISKSKDEWFMIKLKYGNGWKNYKCDQLEGLIQILHVYLS